MKYRQSLEYLFGLQRFGIKLGLENIRAMLERLGHPEGSLTIVHVGGTNGKGSVCAALAEILHRSGYPTGLYSSPHLHSFTERIRIGGVPVTEVEVVELTEEIRALSSGIPATFFEFTTAMALLHFQRRKVDMAVLEVGMGGRLDATNAVYPELCVITPVSLDHSEHLGPDLKAIAAEKGGIIKAGIPVIIGPQEAECLDVLLGGAKNLGAPEVLFGRDFSPSPEPGGFSYRGLDRNLDGLRPALPGAHQHQNLSLALCAAEILVRRGFPIPEAAMRDGVEQVRWPGRLEWWKGGGEVLLDGAHNGGGARVLAAYLGTIEASGIRWVVGMKGDKSVPEILVPLLPLMRQLYCTAPPVEAPLPPQRLVEAGRAAGVPAAAYGSPEAAFQAALSDRREGEVVLVAGSLFLVAAAREFLSDRG